MASQPTSGGNDFDTLGDCLKMLCTTTGKNIPLTTFTKIMDLIERCEEKAFNEWHISTTIKTKYWWNKRYQEWENSFPPGTPRPKSIVDKPWTFDPARSVNLRNKLPIPKKSRAYKEMLTLEDRKFLQSLKISSEEPEEETPA